MFGGSLSVPKTAATKTLDRIREAAYISWDWTKASFMSAARVQLNVAVGCVDELEPGAWWAITTQLLSLGIRNAWDITSG
jgi:hypothetical protein